MQAVNFRSFKSKLARHRHSFRLFLLRTEKNPPRAIDKITPIVAKEVWQETDCLTCANCCKVMTPTYTERDIKRISKHLGETPEGFKKKWLKRANKDWVNKTQPCQFLNPKNNLCTIYSVRPESCSGFPHLTKKKWAQYAHVHKQNIDYCPATFKMVEKITERFGTHYK